MAEPKDWRQTFSGLLPKLPALPTSTANPGDLNRLPGLFLRSSNSPEPSRKPDGPRPGGQSPQTFPALLRDRRVSAHARAVPSLPWEKPRITHRSCANSGEDQLAVGAPDNHSGPLASPTATSYFAGTVCKVGVLCP